MHFRLLGPVEVCDSHAASLAVAPRERAVLAALLLDAGRTISYARLIDTLWDSAPPPTARGQLYSCIHRLRRLLGEARIGTIATVSAGYRIDIDPDTLDTLVFARLVEQAHTASTEQRWDDAIAALRDAEALWRGPALDGIDNPHLRAAAAVLDEQRLTATEHRLNLQLRHHPHRDLVPELTGLVSQHPLREPLHATLMRALHHTGRTAEALAVYKQARTRLADDLGIDPSPTLRELYHSILRNQPTRLARPDPAGQAPHPAAPTARPHPPHQTTGFAGAVRTQRRRLGLTQDQLAEAAGLSVRSIGKLETGQITNPRPTTIQLLADAFRLTGTDRDTFCQTATGTGHPPSHQPVPAQLPPDTTAFTGRQEHLAHLDKRLPDTSAVVITAIGGTAGVGKTALAVHWAHRVRDRFPDGQLFLDLHGFTEAVTPVDPSDALDRLLRALGVPGERIPTDLDDRAGLWRSVLAERRLLIVLDNAATATQVRPLLPGAPGCLLLVTSRRHLASLEATHSIVLDMLAPADAITLFTQAAGLDQAAEPGDLVAEVVELCGRLPLAIRIAAARLRSHPSWRLSDLADRLRNHDQRLAELADGGGERSVTTALELSYQHLTADQQQMYRLLGLHPGHHIEPYAAAALTGSSLSHARRLLDQLHDSHLLQEPAPDRYAFHDLVRAHARHAAIRDEPEPARRAALTRLLDHYRHSTSVAMDAAYPYEHDHRPEVPPASSPTPDLSDPTQASAWLDTELANLLAAARHATHNGWSEQTWHLSAVLDRHLRVRGCCRDAETLHYLALTAARATGHHRAELDALCGLGDAHWRQGRYEAASDHLARALDIARTTGHHPGELDALAGLGQIHWMQGRHQQAIDHYRQALDIARTTGHHPGELDALRGLGQIHWMQGRHQQAIDHYRQALDIARTTGHHPGELDALRGLGHAHWREGRHEVAVNHFEQALEIATATGHRTGELATLLGLGAVHRLQGRHQQAANHYRRALDIARTTGHHPGELATLLGLGHIHRLKGRHGEAADHYRQVLDLAQKSDDRNWQFEAMQGLGRVHHAAGDPETALARHHEALQLATGLGQPADQTRAHDGLAHAYHALHRRDQAHRHWRHALDILATLGTDHIEEEDVDAPTIRAHLANIDQQPVPTRCRSAIAGPPA